MDLEIELLWCDARLESTGFYEKLGFKMKGEIYNVPEIGKITLNTGIGFNFPSCTVCSK